MDYCTSQYFVGCARAGEKELDRRARVRTQGFIIKPLKERRYLGYARAVFHVPWLGLSP